MMVEGGHCDKIDSSLKAYHPFDDDFFSQWLCNNTVPTTANRNYMKAWRVALAFAK